MNAVSGSRSPSIVLLDSGVGGLSVYEALVATGLSVRARLAYCADDAHFPWGTKTDDELVPVLTRIADALVARFRPTVFVIACNTASTLALKVLRSRFPDIAFVGTVPAIKPAALASTSKVIGLLATEATVRRGYVDDLASAFASDCTLLRCGSRGLVRLAERKIAGLPPTREEITAEIAPLFAEAMRVERETGARLDHVVLGCTHFPLLRDEMAAASPWPVAWIDSGPAIARRVVSLVGPGTNATQALEPSVAVFTGRVPVAPDFLRYLSLLGFARTDVLELA